MIGQYARGTNRASFRLPLLHAGAPWKTQKIVRTIMDSLYTDRPDGLCGNDDCGQMSAWYVFSVLGFYPVAPGTPHTVGSPIFPRDRINLPNRKMFVIEAPGVSSANRYIQSVKLNGRSVGGMTLRHDVITSGGDVVFTMGPKPKKDLPGAGPVYSEYAPKKKITAVPFFTKSVKSFVDSLSVGISGLTPGATIYFTSDGTIPNFSSPEYSEPLTPPAPPPHTIASASGRTTGGLLYGNLCGTSRSALR